MTLGQRIQQIRTTLSLSQESFGEKLGTTRQTVSKWELDQTVPELSKIVLMSKLFSVTTDSILIDGISSFDSVLYGALPCGVYRSPVSEIVETERFALVYYCSTDQTLLGTKLYAGIDSQKKLTAVCERDQINQRTLYAYETEAHAVIANNEALKNMLGERYDHSQTKSMKRTETFFVNRGGASLPTVSEAGFKKCLQLWRMSDSLAATDNRFHFFLCTGKTEYIFSVIPQDVNIYCGASYNIPFEMGLFGGKQFFRIRNYQDNTQPFCAFTCDFDSEYTDQPVPTVECQYGKCVQTRQGLMWCVKRYTDDEIVLQGCGDDEYIYHRNNCRTEIFTTES